MNLMALAWAVREVCWRPPEEGMGPDAGGQ